MIQGELVQFLYKGKLTWGYKIPKEEVKRIKEILCHSNQKYKRNTLMLTEPS